MNIKALDELELYELIRLAYPEKFPEDDDETWDAISYFVEDELVGTDAIADLLGRVVMLSMPMHSELSGMGFHALGEVITKTNGEATMIAAVKRATGELAW